MYQSAHETHFPCSEIEGKTHSQSHMVHINDSGAFGEQVAQWSTAVEEREQNELRFTKEYLMYCQIRCADSTLCEQ